MNEWIYRASSKVESAEKTLNRVFEHQFLCRTAFNVNGALIANVQHVMVGDILHVIFSLPGGLEYAGSFKICEETHQYHESWIKHPTETTDLSLFCVKENSPLARGLEQSGLLRDPVLKCFTGWYLSEVDVDKIDAESLKINGQGTLHKFLASEVGVTASNAQLTVDDDELHLAATLHHDRLTPSERDFANDDRLTLLMEKLTKLGCISIGVDWSGAQNAGQKIWVATVQWCPETLPTVLSIVRPFQQMTPHEVAKHFASWLSKLKFNVVGLDFCFGVLKPQQISGMPNGSAAVVGAFVRENYATPDAFREAFAPESKRITDRLRNSPFAPTNLRMYKQVYWGLRSLAGVSSPILPWTAARDGLVVEILPALLARCLAPGQQYKGTTAEACEGRKEIVTSLCEGLMLQITPELKKQMVDDAEGDMIDAVLAALEAGMAWQSGFVIPEKYRNDALREGWIYSSQEI